MDQGLSDCFKAADDEADQTFRRHPVDGCLEKYVRVGKTGVEHYVPVVPAGTCRSSFKRTSARSEGTD